MRRETGASRVAAWVLFDIGILSPDYQSFADDFPEGYQSTSLILLGLLQSDDRGVRRDDPLISIKFFFK